MAIFELNEIENNRANKFKKWHKRCRPKNNNDMFPQYAPFQYIFTQTSIGIGVDIICPYCGNKKDITDYNCW